MLLEKAVGEGGFENIGSGCRSGSRVDEKMNSDTLVTDAAFEAFLHCETKAYLLHESIGSQSKFGVSEQGLTQLYKQRVSEWLISRFGDDEWEMAVSTEMP